MNAVAADDEQEITTLDLPVKSFSVLFEPVAMLGKAFFQSLRVHFILKSRRIFDELTNDLALRSRILQQFVLDKNQADRLIVFIYFRKQHVNALELATQVLEPSSFLNELILDQKIAEDSAVLNHQIIERTLVESKVRKPFAVERSARATIDNSGRKHTHIAAPV